MKKFHFVSFEKLVLFGYAQLLFHKELEEDEGWSNVIWYIVMWKWKLLCSWNFGVRDTHHMTVLFFCHLFLQILLTLGCLMLIYLINQHYHGPLVWVTPICKMATSYEYIRRAIYNSVPLSAVQCKMFPHQCTHRETGIRRPHLNATPVFMDALVFPN